MADALISPLAGGTMLAVSGGLIVWSSKRLQKEDDHSKVPMMGVLGAFVFAAQMVNFSIPGTGSSGHIGGGLLLAMLLGPSGGFIAIASILLVQALFFADGGLLAYGCNCFNLGFIPCFIVYPLFFGGKNRVPEKETVLLWKTGLAGIVALQLGAFGVVLQTWISGITPLSLVDFLLLMQPIHLAIGVIEGLITAGIVVTIIKTRPDILYRNNTNSMSRNLKPVLVAFALLTLSTGIVLSWFASTNPDGLEWSVMKVTGEEEPATAGSLANSLAELQETTAVLPDYNFESTGSSNESDAANAWPDINKGTSLAGLVGSCLTLFLILLIVVPLKMVRRRTPRTV